MIQVWCSEKLVWNELFHEAVRQFSMSFSLVLRPEQRSMYKRGFVVSHVHSVILLMHPQSGESLDECE